MKTIIPKETDVMLHKQQHLTYNVKTGEFLRNFEYLAKYSEKAGVSISVRRRDKIIATLLAPAAVEEISDFVEKMELKHQTDQAENKRLKKEVAALRLRLSLQENLDK